MFFFKNAEELNALFMRNKDMNMLLNEKDRSTLDNLINKLSEDIDSNLLKTILELQVIHFSVFKLLHNLYNYYFRRINIPLKLFGSYI